MGFGTKAYGTFRVSVITPAKARAPALKVRGQAADFEYSKPFEYKWTGNALHTTQVVQKGAAPVPVSVDGVGVSVGVPAAGAGVVGVLIADPCVELASITSLVSCS